MRSKLMFCLIFNLLLSGCGGWIGARAPVEDLGTKTSAMGKSSRANGSPQQSPTPSMQRAPDEASEALFQTISALGVDYRYGGSSHVNGFDCSGLVAHVFRTAYLDELSRRLRRRGTETEEQVSTRLRNASSEMQKWRDYRYTVISGSMEEDIEKFRGIMRAERYLTRRLNLSFS
jgi:hypothetical protein